MKVEQRMRVSAQDATTATLVPVDGETSVPDTSDKITQIVVTFAAARDTQLFDVTNRQFDVALEKK